MTVDLVRDVTFGDVLADHRRHCPDRPAVAVGEDCISYRELADDVDALTTALREEGFVAGDRLVWLGGDSVRLLEYFLAAERLGGVFCPVDTRRPRETIDAILDDCAPAFVVPGERGPARRTCCGGRSATAPAGPDAPLLMLYSMLGGRAVGMQVPRAAILHEVVHVALRENTHRSAPARLGPLHHIAPLVSALAAILSAATAVVAVQALPGTLLEL